VIMIRMRREVKLYGQLTVNVKEADLDTAIFPDVKMARCVLKLKTQAHELPPVEGKSVKTNTHFAWKAPKVLFDVNETNHVFDVFVVLMRGDGIAALPTAAMKKEEVKKEEKEVKKEEKEVKKEEKEVKKEEKKELKKDETKKETKEDATTKDDPLVIGQARLSLYDSRGKFSGPLPIITNDLRHVGWIKVESKMKKNKEGSTGSSTTTTSSTSQQKTVPQKQQQQVK